MPSWTTGVKITFHSKFFVIQANFWLCPISWLSPFGWFSCPNKPLTVILGQSCFDLMFGLAWRWPFINVSKGLFCANGDPMTRDRHSDHPSHYVSPPRPTICTIYIHSLFYNIQINNILPILFAYSPHTSRINDASHWTIAQLRKYRSGATQSPGLQWRVGIWRASRLW